MEFTLEAWFARCLLLLIYGWLFRFGDAAQRPWVYRLVLTGIYAAFSITGLGETSPIDP